MDVIRVVICDDNPSVLVTLGRALGYKRGIEVVGEAASFEELLDVIRQRMPDVILLDHNMPGTNGREAVRTLRDDGDHTPVVMMSADRRNEEPSLAAGALSFFYKGTTDLPALVELLRTAAASRDTT